MSGDRHSVQVPGWLRLSVEPTPSEAAAATPVSAKSTATRDPSWLEANTGANWDRTSLGDTLVAGQLRKKSRWLGRWNLRQLTLIPATGAVQYPHLLWQGGSQAGVLELDHQSKVSIDKDVLVISRPNALYAEHYYFKASPEEGSRSLQEWNQALELAIGK